MGKTLPSRVYAVKASINNSAVRLMAARLLWFSQTNRTSASDSKSNSRVPSLPRAITANPSGGPLIASAARIGCSRRLSVLSFRESNTSRCWNKSRAPARNSRVPILLPQDRRGPRSDLHCLAPRNQESDLSQTVVLLSPS